MLEEEEGEVKEEEKQEVLEEEKQEVLEEKKQEVLEEEKQEVLEEEKQEVEKQEVLEEEKQEVLEEEKQEVLEEAQGARLTWYLGSSGAQRSPRPPASSPVAWWRLKPPLLQEREREGGRERKREREGERERVEEREREREREGERGRERKREGERERDLITFIETLTPSTMTFKPQTSDPPTHPNRQRRRKRKTCQAERGRGGARSLHLFTHPGPRWDRRRSPSSQTPLCLRTPGQTGEFAQRAAPCPPAQ